MMNCYRVRTSIIFWPRRDLIKMDNGDKIYNIVSKFLHEIDRSDISVVSDRKVILFSLKFNNNFVLFGSTIEKLNKTYGIEFTCVSNYKDSEPTVLFSVKASTLKETYFR